LPPNRRAVDALVDAIAGDRPDWWTQAHCRGLPTDWWFPAPGKNANQAKAVCGDCNVRLECFTFAIDRNETFGVWGGVPAGRRKDIRLGRNRT
jgi:WhiB family redox-sensing transcriptional regulator